jgi:hypothetical protein
MSENQKASLPHTEQNCLCTRSSRQILEPHSRQGHGRTDSEWEFKMKHLNPNWRPSRNTIGEYD